MINLYYFVNSTTIYCLKTHSLDAPVLINLVTVEDGSNIFCLYWVQLKYLRQKEAFVRHLEKLQLKHMCVRKPSNSKLFFVDLFCYYFSNKLCDLVSCL